MHRVQWHHSLSMQHDYACAPSATAVNVGDYAFVGDNAIGMPHTSYGRFTYVNDAHGDAVYKIDNAATRSSETDQRLADDTRAKGPRRSLVAHIGFAKNVIPERRLRRACVIASAP